MTIFIIYCVQDAREPFDIHQYGSRILGVFVNKNDVKTFKDVVTCNHSFQISRMFAATLQLVSCKGPIQRGLGPSSLLIIDII